MIEINFFLNVFKKKINNIKSKIELENLKIKYIGKHGLLTNIIKNIKNCKKTEKPIVGKILNEIKFKIISLIFCKINEFEKKKETKKFIDITLPGIGLEKGKFHPISIAIKKIISFFESLNFDIVYKNEIEDVYHNFDALNIPIDHPSRCFSDTFYLKNNYLLRTHTSNAQIRIIKNNIPPLKIISVGKVYRKDSDNTHTPMFHQIEGFVIDKNLNLSQLKGLLINFINNFFEKTTFVNLRPSYFPFTEPSMEIDIKCVNCDCGCVLCGYTGWIEILGCGIIHPIVLKNCNIKKKYNGFAFGMGIERLSMIYHGVDDLRLYYENNLDFLKQF